VEFVSGLSAFAPWRLCVEKNPRFSLPSLRALIPVWRTLGANEEAAKQRVSRVIAFSARRGRHHFHAGQIAVELFHPGRP